ncbi:hypothetical protein FPZ49_30985 [Paenibacillus cremeus]|uniref:Uncharacterized protein n=2 Tax=Paenibacillus cremeus TaxID=2163881 RepID=A0A559JVN4_9BACL|nr:hypothetical protein FPZ49_30985 [Paenibacillus cremeus]
MFTWLVIEYSLTSYVSVIADNAQRLVVAKNTPQFIIFRLTEIVVLPLLLLFFLEAINSARTNFKKLLLAAFWTGLLTGVEALLVFTQVLTYQHWNIGRSMLAWAFFVGLAYTAQLIYSRILLKEGLLQC